MKDFYLFCSLNIVMFFLNVSILLPVAVAVGITHEEHIKCFPHSWKYILQRKIPVKSKSYFFLFQLIWFDNPFKRV